MTERTFLHGLSVQGPNAELGLTADQSAQYAEGFTGELPPGILEAALAAGVLVPVAGDPAPAKPAKKKGRVENLADFDGDGAPGGDAGANQPPEA